MKGPIEALKRPGLALAALVCAATAGSAARAESFYVVEGNARSMSLIDMDSVKRTGDLSKVWRAVAYAGVPDDKVYSARVQLEFDCKAAKVHTLSSTTYSLDDGVLAQSSAAGEWQAVEPGTPMASYAKFACGKGRPDPAASLDDKLSAIAKNYRKAVAR